MQIPPPNPFIDSAITQFVSKYWKENSGIRAVSHYGQSIRVVVALKSDAKKLPLSVTGKSGDARQKVAVLPFIGTGDPRSIDSEKLVQRGSHK